MGDDGRFKRRTASWDEMPAAAQPVLERFIAQRLLTRSVKDGRRTVEVVHESLFRVWPELAGWFAESREFLLWRQRLRSDVADWEHSGKPASLLWPVGRLAEARRWLDERPSDLSDEEQQFLWASVAEREREADRQRQLMRRLWFAASAAFTLALIASAASGLALVARRRALDNERIAKYEKSVADEQKLKAQSQTAIAEKSKRLADEQKSEAQISLAQNHYVQGLSLLERKLRPARRSCAVCTRRYGSRRTTRAGSHRALSGPGQPLASQR